MHSKAFLPFIICIFFSFQVLTAKPVKLQIDSKNETFPTVRSDDKLLEVTAAPFLADKPYLLSSNSKNEIRLYDIYDNPKAFFVLSELTDIQLSGESPNFIIDSNFGRFRCITSDKDTFIIQAKNDVTIVVPPNSDIIYSCISDFNRMHNVNLAVFNGEVKIYKGKKVSDENQFTFSGEDFILSVMPMQIAEIENPQMINIDDISQESLDYFQKTNSRKAGTLEIEKGIRPVLEALVIRQNNYSETNDDIIFSSDNTDKSELIQMEKKPTVITDFTKFKFAFLFSDNKIGGTIGWHPNIYTSNNLFELELRFDFSFQVALSGEFSIQNTPINTEKIWNHFLILNNFRSEWFIDSIVESKKPEEKVLSIMENLFVKIDKLRWGNENTPFYFAMGTKKAKIDKNALRYFFYSPSLFLPTYRATSIDFEYRNSYITTGFFIENAPYGGLIDNCVQFFTPLKSMKSRIEINFAIDTHRLRQITLQNDSNAALPLYANIGWSFTPFDISYFGYEFYLNAGLVFPFTAGKDNVFSMNPENLKNMINLTFGQKLRADKSSPAFSIEFLFKSANIYPFTPLYFLFKDKYLTNLAEGCDNSDYNIGVRLGLLWEPLSWINIHAFYRPTALISNLFNENKAGITALYDDNFLTGVTLSPPVESDKITGSLTFALEWTKPAAVIFNAVTSQTADNLCENLAMHVCIETTFAKAGSLCTNFSIIPSAGNVKFNGEIYFTISIKEIKNFTKRRSNVTEKRLQQLKKRLSEQEENKPPKPKENFSQKEENVQIKESNGENNEN